MPTLNDNNQSYENAFKPINQMDMPLAGVVLNRYMKQTLRTAVCNLEGLVGGRFVVINNNVTPSTGTNGSQYTNPTSLFVYSEVKDGSPVSGILLESNADIIPQEGGASVPFKNSIVPVALFGDGLELYMPASSSLDNITIGNPIVYEYESKQLNLATASTVSNTGALDIKIVSSVIMGKKKVWDEGEKRASWVDSLVVKIRI